MRTIHSTALLLALAVAAVTATAAPALAQNVTPQQAQALLQQRPDLAAQVRQRVGSSGLTQAQIRDRLREQGYDPSLLDPYMGGAAGGDAAAPGNDVLGAMRALGIASDTDLTLAPRAATVPSAPDDGRAKAAPTGRADSERIFGLDLFRNPNSQFLPNLDGPVDPEYRLGPGDELVLILTGDVELAHTLQVTREGFVVIPQVGQLSVANLSLAQLDDLLYARLGKVYSGVRRGAGATTHFSVSVARLRSLQVFVTGDVVAPGSYRVSSAGTALTALYAAGGPSDRGSLRRVELRRGGKVVSQLDVYDYLLKGDASRDLRLRSGDVIFVGVHGPQVRIDGEITRPATYEMLPTESLADLVNAAGGYTPTASERRLSIERIIPAARRTPGGRDRAVIDVSLEATPSIALEAGDIVRVRRVADRVRGRVVVAGQVWQPDTIGIGSGLTLSQALRRAGGLKPDALLGNVLISRLRDDSTRVQLRAEVRDTSGAVTNDLPLQEDDEITVFSRTEFRPERYVAVTGAVRRGGRVAWREGMTLRDALLQVGGLAEGASVEFAEIARRPEVLTDGELARTQRVAIDSSYLFDEGRARGSAPEVALQPFDNVLMFRRPDYEAARVVTIMGEVKYPGSYTIKNKSETVTDLVRRAGGLTHDANSDAASFMRLREAAAYAAAVDLGRGTSKVTAAAADRVRIGLDLANALRDNKSSDNLLLQAGDELTIPPLRQTVEIRGEVNSPTVTALASGKPLSYYIRAGGGPTTKASTRRAYVVQPNGKVESRGRLLWTFDLDPTPRAGSTVVVPVRDTTANRGNAMASVSMFAQLVASLAAVWAITRK
ncbi:MAG: SLBB domain-containing protein [Gemmatimonadaceae bacterium]